jgi:hypothetical protein
MPQPPVTPETWIAVAIFGVFAFVIVFILLWGLFHRAL